MFKTKNRVRMHDTDMAGILYFARQFRFAHDALEDFMDSEGYSFQTLFNEMQYAFVIVHAEADYKASVQVGDPLDVEVTIEKIGESSFTVHYDIFLPERKMMGVVKTVHCTLDTKTRKKVALPEELRTKLSKHLRS